MSPGFKSRLLATQSDARLALLVRAGNEPAFEALVHRYRRPLLRYCRRLCPSEAKAEEVLQQTLLNAWVALRREAQVEDVRAWMYKIAHNAAINAMRGERTLPFEELSQDLIERGARGSMLAGSGDANIDDALALRDALTQMAALPEMQREVIVRTAVGGHSHTEVASALGISAGAVRGLLYRARATMRDGVTAVTPMPLLAWIAGAGGEAPSGGERIAELAAGGTAGLASIAAKGAVVAVTAGVAIGGAAIVRDHRGHVADRRARARHAGIAVAGPAASLRGAIRRASPTAGKLVGESQVSGDTTVRSAGRSIRGDAPAVVLPVRGQTAKPHREPSTPFHVWHRDQQTPVAESHEFRLHTTHESQPAGQGGSSRQAPGGAATNEPEKGGGGPESGYTPHGDWHEGESQEADGEPLSSDDGKTSPEGTGETDSKDNSSSSDGTSRPAGESAGSSGTGD